MGGAGAGELFRKRPDAEKNLNGMECFIPVSGSGCLKQNRIVKEYTHACYHFNLNIPSSNHSN
jgi:hypothetical protein